MSAYLDADAIVRWEKREFDLPAWLDARGGEPFALPATVWQQLQFGVFAWEKARADKRARSLEALSALPVRAFDRLPAEHAARLQAHLKRDGIGFADFQIAATTVVDNAELLTFNKDHSSRVPGLRLASEIAKP